MKIRQFYQDQKCLLIVKVLSGTYRCLCILRWVLNTRGSRKKYRPPQMSSLKNKIGATRRISHLACCVPTNSPTCKPDVAKHRYTCHRRTYFSPVLRRLFRALGWFTLVAHCLAASHRLRSCTHTCAHTCAIQTKGKKAKGLGAYKKRHTCTYKIQEPNGLVCVYQYYSYTNTFNAPQTAIGGKYV